MLRVCLVLLVIGLVAVSPPTAGAEPRFGTFTGDPYMGNVDETDRLESQLRRRITVVNWYQSWGGGSWIRKVQPHLVKAVTRSGRVPLITWEPWDARRVTDNYQRDFTLGSIVRGDHDRYIRSWARGLKRLDTRIYLRPMHEMNGNWYPWGGTVGKNTPALYRSAWRHIVRIFRRAGASKVRFVWSPYTESSPDTRANRMERYYPGSRWVDVMALDGYNWGSEHPEFGGWRSFAEVFSGPYERLKRLGPEPIWIAEVASAPVGGDKAGWVRDMWRTAATWDRLDTLVWFDEDKEADWRAAHDPRVAASFFQG